MLYKVEWQPCENAQEWESTGFNDLMEAIKFYYDKNEHNYHVQLTQRLMENLNENVVISNSKESDRRIYLKCLKDTPDFTKGEEYMVLDKYNSEWNVIDDTKSLHIVSGNYSDDSWLLEHFTIL